jgi:predicted metallopeptidase
MAQQEKLYEKVPEAETIVTNLAAKYTDVLWAVRPNMIEVLGITNKERPKSSNKLAAISPLKGATKALMQINNVNTRYLIELYYSDWNDWSMAQKVAVIFHELVHIADEVGKTVKHDVEDFRIMVDKLGVEWFHDPDLPNLLDKKIEFNLNLRPNVPDVDDPKLDTGDEIIDDDNDTAVDKEPEEIIIDEDKDEDDEGPF